jgi:hypothetical protein
MSYKNTLIPPKVPLKSILLSLRPRTSDVLKEQ